MEHLNLADKLWDMANYVTGFAVAQVIATSFAIGKKELKALSGALAHWLAFGVTLIFTTFYISAIVWCGHRGLKLNADHPEILYCATGGRIGAVLLFTFVLMIALLGHWRDEARRYARETKTSVST